MSQQEVVQEPRDTIPNQYTIDRVTFVTERPLPKEVIGYIGQWARDPIWDIWDVDGFVSGGELKGYEPELRAYAAAYDEKAKADWREQIDQVSDLHLAKIAFVRRDYETSNARANIVMAESLQRLSEVAETILDNEVDGSAPVARLLKAVEHLAYNQNPWR